MRGPQIYLTGDPDDRIGSLAGARGVSKAAVIRGTRGGALETGDAEADARAVITRTAGICAGYPDWPEWLESVRSGSGADGRLKSLGL